MPPIDLDPARTSALEAWMERNQDDDNILSRVRREAKERLATHAQAMIQEGSSRADVAKRFGVSAELLDRALPPPPPPKAPEPFLFSDSDVAEIRDQKVQFAYLQNALDLLRRQAPSAPPARAASAPERAPELDRAQRRADLLGKLKPLLVEEETEREKARLARRAMKRMARGR
jgi:DNA-binding phage protein